MKFVLFIIVIIDNLNVFLANNDNCGVNDLNALMVRLLQLRTEFNNLKIQHTEQITVLKEEINNKSLEIKLHTEQIAVLKEEINNKSLEIKLINEENRKQETELEELRQDVNNTSLEIAAISKDIEMIKASDDCMSSLCQNGATCNDGVNSYTCTCSPGYTGTYCDTDIDECTPDLCKNGATCTDGVDSYTCTCVAGYTGTNCETDIDECTPDLCKNGATCTDGVDSYTCTCVAGYTGTNCETEYCPANWYFFQESCYFSSTKVLTWLEAEEDCIDLGGHLVEITSEQENNFVQSIIKDVKFVWIGLNDKVSEGVYVWVSSGNTASGVYTQWDSGEPNDYKATEDCVEMYASNGNWNDMRCSDPRGYICEQASMSA